MLLQENERIAYWDFQGTNTARNEPGELAIIYIVNTLTVKLLGPLSVLRTPKELGIASSRMIRLLCSKLLGDRARSL